MILLKAQFSVSCPISYSLKQHTHTVMSLLQESCNWLFPALHSAELLSDQLKSLIPLFFVVFH